jgi:hypothetical protein
MNVLTVELFRKFLTMEIPQNKVNEMMIPTALKVAGLPGVKQKGLLKIGAKNKGLTTRKRLK